MEKAIQDDKFNNNFQNLIVKYIVNMSSLIPK